MTPRRILVAIVLVGALLRIAPALRDLDTVDRIFVPDDTYYTLAISRSLAHGDGPMLGGERTSGFQPLLAFVTVPVFAATDNPDIPLRYVILLGALADLVSIWLLWRIARRVAGDGAGLLAAGLWALSPVAIANALGGLETGISLCAQLAVVEAFCIAHERGSASRSAVAGVLAGLALLARVDSVFLVAGLGLYELVRGNRRMLGVAVAAAAVVVAPWWGYSIAVFGSPIPESGAAVRDIVAIHRELYLTPHMATGWAAGTVIGAPMLDIGGLRDLLFAHAAAAWAAWLAVVVVAGATAARWMRRSDEHAIVAMFLVHAIAILVFYTFVVSALWFFRRYLVPAECAATLLVAVGFSWLLRGERPRRLAGSLLAAGCFAIGLVGAARYSVIAPAVSPDTGLHGAKGYREAVRDVFAVLPTAATVGAFQSGALAYYAPAGVRVINLDGVVDHRAADAGRSRRLADYAQARGMTHLADWKFNIDNFVRLSRNARNGSSIGVRQLGHARSQGPGDQFLVIELNWR